MVKAMLMTEVKVTGVLLASALTFTEMGALTYQALAAGKRQHPAGTAQLEPVLDTKSKRTPAKSGPEQILFRQGRDLVAFQPGSKENSHLLRLADWDDAKGILPFSCGLSPDARRIAYLLFEKAEDGSFSGKLQVRDLSRGGGALSLDVYGQFWCWSPDGERLAVTRLDEGFSVCSHLVVDVRNGKKTVLNLAKDQIITDWSADGDWLLTTTFFAADKLGTVNIVKRDGSMERCLSDPKVSSLLGRFAPGGRKLLYFTMDPKTQIGRVFVADLQSGERKPVSPELDGRVAAACWSPDGKRIAYQWSKDAADPEAYRRKDLETFVMVMDADGANSTLLATVRVRSINDLIFPTLEWRQGS
jgi:dipeptidyl aminopeptidase/acylaminoacyl peptidase